MLKEINKGRETYENKMQQWEEYGDFVVQNYRTDKDEYNLKR